MGAWQEIVDYTVPSNTTSVTFDNFGTITKNDFIKIAVTSVNALNETMNLFLTANNLNNHHIQILFAGGTSVGAFRGPDSNGGLIGQHIALGDTNQSFVYLKLSENGSLNTFSNYNIEISSDLRKRFCYNTSIDTLSTITSLTFNSNKTNGLSSNSRIQIYKLTAKKVADVVVNANTTQVDITGLNIKKGDEYLLVSDVLNSTASGNNYYRFFVNNNTTNSNYYSQELFGTGETASTNRTNEPRYLVATGSSGRSITYSHIKLSNIGAFTSQNYCLLRSGTTTPTITNFFLSSTFENITSLTQLNIQSDASNAIGATSRFQLYKLYEGGN